MRAPAALLALALALAVAAVTAAPAPGRSIAGAKRRRAASAATSSSSGRRARRLVAEEMLDPATNLILPPELPTRVYTSVVLNSLVKLDVMDSSFYADAYVAAAWVDERLANATEYDPATMFNPDIEYINRRDITEEPWVVHFDFPLWLEGRPGLDPGASWLIAETRIMGSFACDVSLRDFPQDVQTAYLAIESFDWNASRLEFVPVTSSLTSPQLAVLNWRVLNAGATLALQTYPTFKESYSRATYWVRVKRQSDFYFFTVGACRGVARHRARHAGASPALWFYRAFWRHAAATLFSAHDSRRGPTTSPTRFFSPAPLFCSRQRHVPGGDGGDRERAARQLTRQNECAAGSVYSVDCLGVRFSARHAQDGRANAPGRSDAPRVCGRVRAQCAYHRAAGSRWGRRAALEGARPPHICMLTQRSAARPSHDRAPVDTHSPQMVFAALHFLDEASVRKRYKAAIAASRRNLLTSGSSRSLLPVPGQPPPPDFTLSDRNMMLHRWDSSYIFEDELLAAAEEDAAEAEAAAAAAAAKKAEAERTHAHAPAVARLGGVSTHGAGVGGAAAGDDGAFAARNPMHSDFRAPGTPLRHAGADGKFTAVPLMAVRTMPAGGDGDAPDGSGGDDGAAAGSAAAAQQSLQQTVRHRPASTGARAAAAGTAGGGGADSSGSSEAISQSQATIPGAEDDDVGDAAAAAAAAAADTHHRHVRLQSVQRPPDDGGDRPPPLRHFHGKRPHAKPIECCCGRVRMRPIHVKEHRRVDFAIAGAMVLVYVIGAASIFSTPTSA
jgi:hypothetical protein